MVVMIMASEEPKPGDASRLLDQLDSLIDKANTQREISKQGWVTEEELDAAQARIRQLEAELDDHYEALSHRPQAVLVIGRDIFTDSELKDLAATIRAVLPPDAGLLVIQQ